MSEKEQLMAQVYALDAVIRREDDPERGSRAVAETLVMIDARNGSHVPRKTLFSRADLRYYVVSNDTDPRNAAQGSVAGLQLKDLEHAITVSVTYEVRCPAGHETRVALSLFDPSAPAAAVLERHFTRWIIDLARTGLGAFVTSYLADRERMEAGISARALAETGLDLRCRLVLDAELALAPIVVTRNHLRVVVSDFVDEEQDLSIRVTLDVDPHNRVPAILLQRRADAVQELVVREVLRFVRQELTMHAFCTDLDSPELRASLARWLEPSLAPFGRRVSALKLEAKPCGFKFFFQAQRDVTCKLHEYPTPVVISNKVQMTLTNPARYKSAHSPDPHAWLQQKLDRFVPQLLFDAHYIDVLIRFQLFEKEIKRILSEEAAKIGYEIRQLITVPDLEPIKLKEPFTIDVTGAFETRLSNFHVKLQMVVTLRIPRLEDIESYLNRQQHVPKLIEDAIISAVRQHLHGIEPRRFYMEFNYAEKAPSVEQELVGRIATELDKKFRAEVIDVVLKVVDTEIIERLRKFQQSIHPFVVDVASLHGSEPLTFRGNFQVEAVHEEGWDKFQKLTIGIDDVRQLLEEHLLAKLQTLPPEMLQFRDPKAHLWVETTLTRLAQNFVQNQFGLVISVTNVHRDRTGQEAAAAERRLTGRSVALAIERDQMNAKEAAERARSQALLTQLQKLLDRRTQETDGTENDDDLAELDRKIESVRTELSRVGIPDVGDVADLLLPPTLVTREQFAHFVGLPELAPAPEKPEGDPE